MSFQQCAICGQWIRHIDGYPPAKHMDSSRHRKPITLHIPPDLLAKLGVLQIDLQERIGVGKSVTLKDAAMVALRAGIESAIVREADRIADRADVEPF